MAEGKDGKKKVNRGDDRRDGEGGKDRRDLSKKNFKLEQSRRKGSRRSGKERRD